jgi:hypothetical protein
MPQPTPVGLAVGEVSSGSVVLSLQDTVFETPSMLLEVNVAYGPTNLLALSDGRIWDLASRALIWKFPAGPSWLVPRFVLDGRSVAFGSTDSVLTVRYIDNAGQTDTLKDPEGHHVDPLAVSPDGRFVVTETYEPRPYGGTHHVRLWDLSTQSLVSTLQQQQRLAYWERVVFSADGRYVVGFFGPSYATNDKSVRVTAWHAGTGALLWDRELVPDYGLALAHGPFFVPDGELVAVATIDGVWKIRLNEGYIQRVEDTTQIWKYVRRGGITTITAQ